MNTENIQDIEQAIIGAVIMETRSIMPQISDLLEPEHFRTESLGKMWEALKAMDSQALHIDMMTFSNYLITHCNFPELGTRSQVSTLGNNINQSGNIVTHAYILKQDYINRQLFEVGKRMQHDAMDVNTDPLETLRIVSGEIIDLNQNTVKNEPKHISRLTPKHKEEVKEISQSKGGVIGIPIGVDSLDSMIGGFQNGKLYIIAARPGMGKSIVANQAARMASFIGAPALLVNLEMGYKEIIDRLLASIADVDANTVATGNYAEGSLTERKINDATELLDKHPLYVHDVPSMTITELIATARRLHYKLDTGIGMVVVDYLQLMSGENKKGQNREQEISTISRGLKMLSKELDVPVIALSQLSRAVETRGGDKKPMLSDLRESGSIEQDADAVIFPFRPSYYGITEDESGNPIKDLIEFHVAKQRGGRTGTVEASIDLPKMKISDFNDIGYNNQPSNISLMQGNYSDNIEPNF